MWWSGKLNWFRLQIYSRLQAAGLSLQDNLERSCQDEVYCGKADNRLYTSSYCQSVITGRDRGTQWKIAMTGQCLHHPKIGAEACAISQWRLESDFELSWCARVAQRAKGSKKRGGTRAGF